MSSQTSLEGIVKVVDDLILKELSESSEKEKNSASQTLAENFFPEKKNLSYHENN